MDKKDFRIVFMGTPEFAVPSLRALVEGGYKIAGVITMPDKPAGRGYKVQFSAVKEYALSQNLKILQPEKLKNPDFLEELKELKADLQVVVAFRMLPEVVWMMPKYGTFNLHAALLPQYRGAAPVNWAVINGDKETGVTTFFIDKEIDTGKIIEQVKIPIADTDNVGIVYDRLMHLGAKLVLKTTDSIFDGTIETVPQRELYSSNEELRPAPKIFKETCEIDWNKGVKQVYDFIRGLSPYPAAWTYLSNNKGERIHFKIYASEKLFEKHSFLPGTVRSDGKTFLDVAAVGGFVRITELQADGKKKMSAKEYLIGKGRQFV